MNIAEIQPNQLYWYPSNYCKIPLVARLDENKIRFDHYPSALPQVLIKQFQDKIRVQRIQRLISEEELKVFDTWLNQTVVLIAQFKRKTHQYRGIISHLVLKQEKFLALVRAQGTPLVNYYEWSLNHLQKLETPE